MQVVSKLPEQKIKTLDQITVDDFYSKVIVLKQGNATRCKYGILHRSEDRSFCFIGYGQGAGCIWGGNGYDIQKFLETWLTQTSASYPIQEIHIFENLKEFGAWIATQTQ